MACAMAKRKGDSTQCKSPCTWMDTESGSHYSRADRRGCYLIPVCLPASSSERRIHPIYTQVDATLWDRLDLCDAIVRIWV